MVDVLRAVARFFQKTIGWNRIGVLLSVAIIRGSKTPDQARERLMSRLKLSEVQARAILEMPLRRLTSLEITQLRDEAKELRARIKYLEGLLESEKKRLAVVAEEARGIRERFASPRRTVIIDSADMAAGTQVGVR